MVQEHYPQSRLGRFPASWAFTEGEQVPRGPGRMRPTLPKTRPWKGSLTTSEIYRPSRFMSMMPRFCPAGKRHYICCINTKLFCIYSFCKEMLPVMDIFSCAEMIRSAKATTPHPPMTNLGNLDREHLPPEGQNHKLRHTPLSEVKSKLNAVLKAHMCLDTSR